MKMLRHVLIGVLCVSGTAAAAQSPTLNGVNFLQGPAVGKLGEVAEVQVPAGFVFAGPDDARTILEAMHNPTTGTEMGFLSSLNEDWFVVFEFDDVGYIRDNEKDSLDADAILASLVKGNDRANVERRRKGWPESRIVGWEQKPSYDESTHNLQWAIRGASEQGESINFNTRLLGRGGVMSATLVTAPEVLASTLPQFKDVLTGFDFVQGQRYAEYRQGDKIAKYGLSALIVGGAAAVAVKTGLAKWVWKALVFGGVAIASVFRKVFKGNRA